MVETITVSSREEFDEALRTSEENPLSETVHRNQCYDCWREHVDSVGERLCILIPEWFADSEIGIRRPIIFAEVEYDDPDSGAVLFSNMEMLNISVVENEALGDLGMSVATETLDISDEDDYIDEAGKMWVPRSLMEVFEHE